MEKKVKDKYINLVKIKTNLNKIKENIGALSISIKETNNAILTLLKNSVNKENDNVAINFQNTLKDYYKKLVTIKKELVRLDLSIANLKNETEKSKLQFISLEETIKLNDMFKKVIRMYKNCEKYQNSKINYSKIEIIAKLDGRI